MPPPRRRAASSGKLLHMPRRVPLPRSFAATVLCTAVATAQVPTCRVEGRVVDPMRQPLAGARVTAAIGGEVLAQTFTDGEGLFVFAPLPMRPIVVRAAGPECIGAEWIDPLGAPRYFTTIVTMPARQVTGTCRDDAGNLVPHAWVVVAPTDCDRLTLASDIAQADDRGAFVLRHVATGPNIVRAWAPGLEAFEGELDGADDATFDCVLERDGTQERTFTIERATAEATAAVRVAIEMRHQGFPLPLPPAVHTPIPVDGAFTVRGWPHADETIAFATCDGAFLAPVVHAVVAGAGVRSRVFAVDATGRIDGRVLGLDRPGAAWLVAEPTADRSPRVRCFAAIGADGRFTLQAPVDVGDRMIVRVIGANAVVDRTPDGRAWRIETHDAGRGLEVPVHAAHTVRVTVARDDRRPVVGARVELVAKSASPPDEVPIATAWTGFDGRAEIGGLDLVAPEEMTCRVDSDEGFVDSPFIVAPGSFTDLGVVLVEPGAEIRLHATRDGRAVPGLRVAVQSWLLQDGRDARVVLTTDRAGTLLLRGLRPTTLQFVVGRGDRTTAQDCSVTRDTHMDLELRVER